MLELDRILIQRLGYNDYIHLYLYSSRGHVEFKLEKNIDCFMGFFKNVLIIDYYMGGSK